MRFFLTLALYLVSIPTAWALPGLTQGGVSGGGGNILAPKTPLAPVDPEVAEHLVYRSYGLFRIYIQEKQAAFNEGRLPTQEQALFAPIFTSPERVIEVLRNVRVHVADHRPCRDAQSQPVDGSTLSQEPNSICISAFNIARKTELDDIPPQSAALMVHEYGELLGLSEDQAVQVQGAALQELRAQ